MLSYDIGDKFKNNYSENHLWKTASKLYLKGDSNTDVFLWILNLFLTKFLAWLPGEPLIKRSKISNVSHPLSSLKWFPWNSFESKDSFCCTDVKIKF